MKLRNKPYITVYVWVYFSLCVCDIEREKWDLLFIPQMIRMITTVGVEPDLTEIQKFLPCLLSWYPRWVWGFGPSAAASTGELTGIWIGIEAFCMSTYAQMWCPLLSWPFYPLISLPDPIIKIIDLMPMIFLIPEFDCLLFNLLFSGSLNYSLNVSSYSFIQDILK